MNATIEPVTALSIACPSFCAADALVRSNFGLSVSAPALLVFGLFAWYPILKTDHFQLSECQPESGNRPGSA